MNRAQRGGAPGIEAIGMATVIIVMIAFVVIGAQVASAKDAVRNAASAAARAATQERSAVAAQSAASAVATATLNGSSLKCSNPAIATDTAGFAVPVGTPAKVAVTVSCTAERSYLGILSGGSITYSATGESPLDVYRER